MKNIVCNSKLANLILWANYTTITLTAFVFTEFKDKTGMPQSVRNHECTHARQWIEMFFAGWVIMFILQLIFDISAWWYILPLFSFIFGMFWNGSLNHCSNSHTKIYHLKRRLKR